MSGSDNLKKRIISICLIFTLLISSFTYIKPKNVYASDGTFVLSSIDYVIAFILSTMGVTIPQDETLWNMIKENMQQQEAIRNLIATGIKGGIMYIGNEVADGFKIWMDAIKENPVIGLSGRDLLDEYCDINNLGTMSTFIDYYGNFISGNKWVVGKVGDSYYLYKAENAYININNGVIGIGGGYRYQWDKSLKTWYAPGTKVSINVDSIIATNIDENVTDISTYLTNAESGSTIFPRTDDVVTELTLPTTFPTNISLNDIAGVPTTEWPVDVGVSVDNPYPTDEEVDKDLYPWYWPLTKWFKKVATDVGEVGKTIGDALTGAKDSVVTAIKDLTSSISTSLGKDSNGNDNDWPELPQLLNLLIMILILIIRLVIACLGMVLRLGQIAPIDTYLNEDFKQGLNYLKNQECLPNLTYFNMIIGIGTIIQVCALVKFVRKKISMQVD